MPGYIRSWLKTVAVYVFVIIWAKGQQRENPGRNEHMIVITLTIHFAKLNYLLYITPHAKAYVIIYKRQTYSTVPLHVI